MPPHNQDRASLRSWGLSASRWGAVLGLVLGVLYSVGGLIMDVLTVGLNAGTALAFLALIGMPIIFAVAGFLVGLAFGYFRKPFPRS